ncbi:DUF2971 domain-containing protein [Peptostreptococcus stomatis]|uniref:DUF2971 domain-containing protein n=1 Tax=Peptostreptococcus stomatis TaxID=341694 RepID=UPI003FA17052
MDIKDNKKIKTIEDYLQDYKVVSKLNNEKILYHYTSVEGIFGILNNNKIWATNMFFLNDISEFKYTFDLFEQFFLNKIKNEEIKNSLIERFKGYFKASYDRLPVYVISFSTNEDNLLLWSEFTEKMGYNIGFKIKKLYDTIDSEYKYNNEVIYDIEEQKRRLKESLESFLKKNFTSKTNHSDLSFLENLEGDKLKKTLDMLALEMSYICIVHSIFFKQSIFNQEQEYRICFLIPNENYNKENIQFRLKEDVIFPYIEIDFDILNSLESITIGPKNNIDIAKMGLEIYCRNKEIDPKILKSNIPLRY